MRASFVVAAIRWGKMDRSVLLGSRRMPHARSRATWGLLVWLPVLVMVLIIARESTDRFSSERTSAMLRPMLEAVVGHMENTRWEAVHHALRKSGHFIGYGTLGVTWLRGWLLTWLVPLRLRAIETWRRSAWVMAICCTAVIASIDELHQTWIPSRTGLAQDVLLDTLGALTLCGLVALLWLVQHRVEVRRRYETAPT